MLAAGVRSVKLGRRVATDSLELRLARCVGRRLGVEARPAFAAIVAAALHGIDRLVAVEDRLEPGAVRATHARTHQGAAAPYRFGIDVGMLLREAGIDQRADDAAGCGAGHGADGDAGQPAPPHPPAAPPAPPGC